MLKSVVGGSNPIQGAELSKCASICQRSTQGAARAAAERGREAPGNPLTSTIVSYSPATTGLFHVERQCMGVEPRSGCGDEQVRGAARATANQHTSHIDGFKIPRTSSFRTLRPGFCLSMCENCWLVASLRCRCEKAAGSGAAQCGKYSVYNGCKLFPQRDSNTTHQEAP